MGGGNQTNLTGWACPSPTAGQLCFCAPSIEEAGLEPLDPLQGASGPSASQSELMHPDGHRAVELPSESGREWLARPCPLHLHSAHGWPAYPLGSKKTTSWRKTTHLARGRRAQTPPVRHLCPGHLGWSLPVGFRAMPSGTGSDLAAAPPTAESWPLGLSVYVAEAAHRIVQKPALHTLKTQGCVSDPVAVCVGTFTVGFHGPPQRGLVPPALPS